MGNAVFVLPGAIAAAAAIAGAYVVISPRTKPALIAAAYLAFAFYIVPVPTHDRYLYPFFALMLPVVMADRKWVPLYAVLSVTFFLNLIVVAPPIDSLSGRWVESPLSLVAAAVNVAGFAWMTFDLLAVVVRDAPRLVRELRSWRAGMPAADPAA
jgi:hypothetical protein